MTETAISLPEPRYARSCRMLDIEGHLNTIDRVCDGLTVLTISDGVESVEANLIFLLRENLSDAHASIWQAFEAKGGEV